MHAVFGAILFSASPSFAREGGALHETDRADELVDVEEEAFGTRGVVKTRAEVVSFDARAKNLELSGDVRLDSPPFHLRSQRITLSRTKYGIEAEGKGSLSFCPCLGTPLKIEFDKAIVAPPGELILKNPKLEIYGVPVMYLPWFWMRSDERIGLLPPDIAYRGQDGWLLGGGVHLPWTDRGAKQALDLRGGFYFKGGFVADVRHYSPVATTKIRYDRLPSARAPASLATDAMASNADDGLFVDARGATNADGVVVAWDADVIRGRRGLAASTELDAAAKPWDRAYASSSIRAGAIVAETGFRAVSRRGGDLVAIDASGPFAALRTSGALGSSVTYDATLEGGALRVSSALANTYATPTLASGPGSVSYGRMDAGVLGATTFGPLAASLTARGAGNLAMEGERSGGDRAGVVRLRLATPLARAFASDDASTGQGEPLVHVVEPFVEGAILHSQGNAILGSLPGRGAASISGTAPFADAGVSSTLGRWGRREALELSVAGGVAHDAYVDAPTVLPLARARLSTTFSFLGASVDTAHVLAAKEGGGVVVARVRLGRFSGPHVLANVAAREGIDPVLARALSDAPLEAPAGFLTREGTSGGAGLVVPWARAIATSVGVDVDATSRELVAARAGVELRDRCECVTFRANASHRIGREGVDVWISIDFATDR